MSMMEEALVYFSGDSGYRRLFILFRKKYESLGRIGGTVKIDTFSDQELTSVAHYFGLSLAELRQRGNVSLDQFEQQLQQTKFEGIKLIEVLQAYFGESIVSKKQAKHDKYQHQRLLLEGLQEKFPALMFWFAHLAGKSADTHWIYRLLDESDKDFIRLIALLNEAYHGLPNQFERLPIFSQRISRNPHTFDLNTNLGKLWIHLLAVHRGFDHKLVVPTDSEGINDLLLSYMILRDDISNYVTCANLLAETEQGLHPMWEAATTTHSVMNVPLRELVSLIRIYPSKGRKAVWIVENSGVYSSILDEVSDAPLVCTHGQFKLAALMLFDLLVKQDHTLHYAGDFDPEGLGMAARLLERYPHHVKLWKMDVSAYRTTEADVKLSRDRLNKLHAIKAKALLPVIEIMRQKKRAGYQEALVGEMVAELKAENEWE